MTSHIPRDERGLAESLQWTIIWPVVMLAILGTIQIGMWWHTRLTVGEAAAGALDVLTVSKSTPAQAEAVAAQIAAAGGVDHIEMSTTRTATGVEVTVSAKVPSLVDLPLGEVRQSATGPREGAGAGEGVGP